MIEGIIGRKIGMTETFLEDGIVAIVTVIEAGPCYVVQTKAQDTDGYQAVQLGFEEIKPQRVTKPAAGHFRKAQTPPMRVLKEFALRGGEPEEYKAGDIVKTDIFKEGDIVDITGTSKGKGFAGGMKRHGFSGQPDGHGGMAHRRPGSIGQASYPGKVFKGHKMAGHMGAERVTVQGITVVRSDTEKNLLFIKGSVPGPNGGVVYVNHTTKGRN